MAGQNATVRVIKEIIRQRDNASEYATKAAAVAKPFLKETGHSASDLSATVRRERMDPADRIASYSSTLTLGMEAGHFDQPDFYDDAIREPVAKLLLAVTKLSEQVALQQTVASAKDDKTLSDLAGLGSPEVPEAKSQRKSKANGNGAASNGAELLLNLKQPRKAKAKAEVAAKPRKGNGARTSA